METGYAGAACHTEKERLKKINIDQDGGYYEIYQGL
jgi:hypothetical protein